MNNIVVDELGQRPDVGGDVVRQPEGQLHHERPR